MRVGALDLGSNTFLCLIAEVEGGAVKSVLSDSVEMVRLGEGVAQTGVLSEAALKRAREALLQFRGIIDRYQVDRIGAVATAAARSVKNPEALLSICDELKIPLQIINGEDEARMTYLGGISGFRDPQGDFLMIDIGGGSTEFIYGHGFEIRQKVSLPIGALKVTEKVGHSPDQHFRSDQIEEMRKIIQDELNTLKAKGFDQPAASPRCVGLAGTSAEIGRLEVLKKTGRAEFDADRIDGVLLTLAALSSWEQELTALSPAQLTQNYKVHPKRADVLLAGLLILKTSLLHLGLSQWQVSTRGIRYGLALHLAEGKF